jgi:hypothetical protein
MDERAALVWRSGDTACLSRIGELSVNASQKADMFSAPKFGISVSQLGYATPNRRQSSSRKYATCLSTGFSRCNSKFRHVQSSCYKVFHSTDMKCSRRCVIAGCPHADLQCHLHILEVTPSLVDATPRLLCAGSVEDATYPSMKSSPGRGSG